VLKKNGFMDSSEGQLRVSLNFGSVPYDEVRDSQLQIPPTVYGH
jgi:hypothetical protein